MKKFLSIFLTTVLLATMVVLPTSAATYQVSKGSSTVSVEGEPNMAYAKSVVRLVNKERKAKGLEPLLWSNELSGPAMQRAAELTVSFSHTRPNGTKWNTAIKTDRFFAENIAWNQPNPNAVMDAWMNSSGHRTNILFPNYKSMAVGVVEVNGEYFWVQLFTSSLTDTVDVEEASVDTSGSTSTDKAPATKTPAVKAPAQDTEKADGPTVSKGGTSKATPSVGNKVVVETAKETTGSVTATAMKSAITKAEGSTQGNRLVVKVQNKKTISGETMAEMVAMVKPKGKTVTLVADTLNAQGKKVEGRIYLEPDQLSAWKGDYSLKVQTTGEVVKAKNTNMQKWFTNPIKVIHMEQYGSLGATTHIAALVDLKDMNTETLVFHCYDKNTKTYSPIEKPNYSIDKSGFLHFYTPVGGDIIISDAPLVRAGK